MELIVDNTKRSTYRLCQMKFFLQHEKGLQTDFGSTALRYGSTWHGIQEGFHRDIIKNGWPEDQNAHIKALSAGLELGKEVWDKETEKKTFIDDYRNYNTAVEAFQAYLEFFSDDRNYIEVLHTEQKFSCPIEPESQVEANLLTGLPPITFTGKIDLGVRMDNVNWIWDFKTTGWYLAKVIMEANRSPQLIGYSYAGKKVLDFEPSGCLCSFAYVGATKSKATGNWGKTRFDYRRVPQLYTDDDITAWKLGFIDTCGDIYARRQSGIWTQSFDSCYRYGACPYLKLCKQHASFEDLNLEGFHVDFWDVLDES